MLADNTAALVVVKLTSSSGRVARPGGEAEEAEAGFIPAVVAGFGAAPH